ncbi:MAG: hypothetical protein QF415_16230 [Candidatus Undinarchaeales archaeon]|jgi:hypothetical protein|nr:hypothetical protein [Candidatus Undinarchaeales archaeon]MDP7492878.1 hypothetical protein [Candidatus Undinarchaeales archaeon]
MYEIDLETDGYTSSASADTGVYADDLSKADVATAATIGLAVVGIGSFVGAVMEKSHLEDNSGTFVYSDSNGFAGTNYFIKDADGGYVQVPDDAVERVADNWMAEHEIALGTGAVVGTIGAFVTGIYAHEKRREGS